MREGTIVSLILDRGYGFIHEQSGHPDIYFHVSELGDGLTFNERLKEQRVRFDVVDSPKGPRACNVQAKE